MIRKIDLMHLKFGVCEGHKCGECSNLVKRFYDKTYYKCRCYGLSMSEATDWAKRNVACGLFNKEYDGAKGIWFVKHSQRPKEIEECEGQETLW